MTQQKMDKILADFRDEFQIPPFFSESGLVNYYNEGVAKLKFLNPLADFENDATAQMLLKNYMYYAYNHCTDEFEQNYSTMILSWQLSQEVKE